VADLSYIKLTVHTVVTVHTVGVLVIIVGWDFAKAQRHMSTRKGMRRVRRKIGERERERGEKR